MSSERNIFCGRCGAKNTTENLYCSRCGSRLSNATFPQTSYGENDPTQPATPLHDLHDQSGQKILPTYPVKYQKDGVSKQNIIIAILSIVVVVLVVSVVVIQITHNSNNPGRSNLSSPTNNVSTATPTPSQQVVVPNGLTATPTSQPLIGTQTGTFEGCPYSEVHQAPNGTTWSIDVGNQPTSLEIWSNRTSNQTLYKVWLPNGFHTSDGKQLVFPGGGGEYDTFSVGCNTAAQDWYNRDGTQSTATIDQLLNTYNLAVAQ